MVMDEKLVGWARAVKSRARSPLPPLWLFSDPARMPDLLDTIRRLPGGGLCGVVFRHDGVPGRAELAHRVWLLCRMRRMPMVVAGRDVLGQRSGRHLRGGIGQRGRPASRTRGLRTASAHDVAQLTRASRNAAAVAFLSPAFATPSHPGQAGLGLHRWIAAARRAVIPVFALGGIDGRTVRRLPRWVLGAGAIGAWL
jgi:thiamine-phosphate pyrophosphorylase